MELENEKKDKNKLDNSIKAVNSIKDLLDNGPLTAILSFQTIAIIVSLYLFVQSERSKVSIQDDLYREMLRRADVVIENRVNEKITPVISDVRESVDKLNETRKIIDTTSNRINQIIYLK